MDELTEECMTLTKAAERNHELIASCTHLPNGAVIVTAEFDCVLHLRRLMKIVKKLSTSNDQVSKLVEVRRGHWVARLTSLGRELAIACKVHRECFYVGHGRHAKLRYAGHTLHPYLRVASEIILEADGAINEATRCEHHERLHEAISSLADEIRSRCHAQDFKREVKNFQRNAEAKLRRALKYLLSLFHKRSRLLILRVDLFVRAEAKEWSYSADADDAFDKFLLKLSGKQIVPKVIGWMSAREDGAERGRHYHVLVALNGHYHQAGVNLTKMIGEYWVKECVGSGKIGSYYNCFALAKKYKHLGIGMVHVTDAEKLLGLYYVTRYLCKDDVQFIATGTRPRNFRRGQEVRSSTRLGARRKDEDNLSLVRQIFNGKLRPIKARSKKSVC